MAAKLLPTFLCALLLAGAAAARTLQNAGCTPNTFQSLGSCSQKFKMCDGSGNWVDKLCQQYGQQGDPVLRVWSDAVQGCVR